MSGTDQIQYEAGDHGVVTLWLNRPEKRNGLCFEMLDAMHAYLTEIEQRRDARVLVIRGRGGNFCSGGDLEEAGEPVAHKGLLESQRKLSGLFARIQHFARPTIAVVDGYAIASGFELMLACDFAVAADDAKIGDFHIRRALISASGLLYRLPRMIGSRKARELMMTGRLLSGVEGAQWGVVNRSVPPDLLEKEVNDLCGGLATKSMHCMQITKLAANQGLDAGPDTLAAVETLAINLVYRSEDAQEGVSAFLEKRTPRWRDQ